MFRLLALPLVFLPAFAAAAPAPDQQMTLPEYRKGLKELRGHFVKRDEDPAIAERYIADLETAFPVALGERVPVTHGVFESFLKYQAAWARKTRDGKNPDVTREELQHEIERADALKAAFKAEAEAKSPRFYRAFQAAVQDVRTMRRRDGRAYTGASSVFFSDQIDDSYSHVDAGDEALERGDSATAIKEAGLALGINPANADALVLRAGAHYDRREIPAAVLDAQAALILDPVNRQAQAILSLTGASVPAAAGEERAAPSPTPAVGKMLSEDLSERAVGLAGSDPRGSMGQFGQAVALDPRNANARGWYATLANREGEYDAALGSAEQGLNEDPNDALAYFNKAYALAGAGDKDGMISALTQATLLDPSYKPALVQALEARTKEDMKTVFGAAAGRHQPAAPRPRRRRSSSTMLMLTSVGFLIGLAAMYFLTNSRPVVGRSY